MIYISGRRRDRFALRRSVNPDPDCFGAASTIIGAMPEIIFVAGETASRRASDRRRSQQTRPPNAPNLESAVSIDARHSPFSMPLPKKTRDYSVQRFRAISVIRH